MNVYEVAKNMMAFSDFVVVAAQLEYGGDVNVRAEVKSFRPGSFETDLVFHVGTVASLLAILPTVQSWLETVKQGLDLFKFLGGKPPAETSYVDSQHVEVHNNSGNVYVVKNSSLTLTLDRKAGESVKTFVSDALEGTGVDSVDISAEGGKIVSITSDDAIFFRAIEYEEKITDAVVELGLTIESPNFREGKKWRFWDGSNSILLTMEDKEFIQKIENGESFRKGDTLLCDVRVVQTHRASGLKIERSIIKVKSHKHQLGEQRSIL